MNRHPLDPENPPDAVLHAPARFDFAGGRRMSRLRGAWLFALVAFFATASISPAQAPPPGWPYSPWPAPPMQLSGATLGANIRNASRATANQVTVVRNTARNWQGRISYMGYQNAYYQQDYATLYFQFQGLRQQFNVLASLAGQLGKPRADNVVAELSNGLDIIGEVFTNLQNQAADGTLDRQTVARGCRALDQSLGVWQQELQKSSSRLGLVW